MGYENKDEYLLQKEEKDILVEEKGFETVKRLFAMSSGELRMLFETDNMSDILSQSYSDIKQALQEYDCQLIEGEIVIYKNTMCMCIQCIDGNCILLSDESICYENVNVKDCQRTGERVNISNIFRHRYTYR